ncbi:short-chain dehydrogenase/reductase SDR [Rhizobium sp. PDO1-076]|uniref:SDR family NAD(P)-dependent oxidoreductase n=1 Tax=Rhizobium sp. PDO1-076 TaxID=1125979 RepID=UPI00024E3980|nr:SDR family NAD(P)-dependent oxidoreductase [Rhizobium sp. PDO1-076]EHS50761.1 short-chain dehydrogenase/reductase SDR [Rhizobium sp. PDO1-076]
MADFTGMTSLEPGYTALVLGASGGIGSAFAEVLGADPRCGEVVRLSRSVDGFDVADEDSVAGAAVRLSGSVGRFDLILCATGALTIEEMGPEKAIKAIRPDTMAAQFAVNAIGPALVLKHFSPLLASDRRSLFAALSARVGSIGDNRLGGWISYRAAKAALNQIVRTSAIEIARTRPKSVVVSLHPGSVETGLSSAYAKGHDRLPPTDSAMMMLSVLDRLEPAQSGCFYAYDGQPIDW